MSRGKSAKKYGIVICLSIFWMLLTAVISISQSIKQIETQAFAAIIQNEATHAAENFYQTQTNLYSALKRIALRWQMQEGTPEPLFLADGASYISDFPTLHSISYADKTLRLLWRVPLDKRYVGMSFTMDKERQETAAKALATRHYQTTKLVQLISTRQPGFIFVDPLYVHDRFDGLLIATFDATLAVSHILDKNLTANYYFAVTENGASVFNNEPAVIPDLCKPWRKSVRLLIDNNSWEFILTPRAEFIAGQNSTVAMVFFAGLFISFITSLFIYFWLQSRANAKALYLSEHRLHLATTGTSDGVWDWHLSTGEVYYSPRFMEMLGYREHEIPHTLDIFYQLLHPDDITPIGAEIQAHLRNEKPYDVEYRLKHKRGHYVWFNARGKALYDDQGKPLRMVGFNTDITEKKHAQAELKRNQDWLQSIMNASYHSIIATKLDGTIQLFNKAAERMLGYSAPEMIGKQSLAILHDPSEIAQRVQALALQQGREIAPDFAALVAKLSSQEVDQQEWQYVRKDQSRFPVLLSLTALYVDNKVEGYVGIAQDISDRKALEAMKNEFISIVSHELRTPLTSIQGVMGLLLGGALGNFEAKARKMLTIAHSNCDRLIRLINDILDVEKMAAGRAEFALSNIDVNKLVEESVLANQAFAEKYGVRLKFQSYPAKIWVTADSDRLLQVFTNLISNAIKFSPRLERVLVSVDFKDDQVNIAFADKGSGIPEAFQKSIFQKFSQADSSSVRKLGGTGLGLNISKSIIDKLGGTLTFETLANQGTTFLVKLAAQRALN